MQAISDHIEQSEIWARFQRQILSRGKTWRIGKSFVIRRGLPFGFCWFECPRGRLSAHDIPEIEKIARRKKAVFLRIEPPRNYKFPHGFRPAHAHYQPEETLILDLSLSEDDLLKQMKEKGRYNIRLAVKKGVKVRRSKNAGIFYDLMQKTAARDKFSPHEKSYYEKLLETLSGRDLKKGFAKLFVAEHKNAPLAAIIVTFYKNTAAYYFGASSNEHRNLMAPYLLQWEAVREAKRLGCRFYDFFGIAPENAHSHPWAGVTQFKKKFGGIIIKYPRAREFVFRPFLYFALTLAKKLLRGASAR